MTWTKLSDDFPDDCWRLSDGAFRLHVEALVWSNRKLLDCRIPKDGLARFTAAAAHVAELVELGYWTDDGDEWVVTHHSAYQPKSENVIHISAVNTENAIKRWAGRRPTSSREQFSSSTESDSDPHSESQSDKDGLGQVRSGPGTALISDDVDAVDEGEFDKRGNEVPVLLRGLRAQFDPVSGRWVNGSRFLS